jgi:hypothetical protein
MDHILEAIGKMTDEQKAELLATEFPAELEKEAAAELDMQNLADAVYTYGYLCAERGIAEADGIDKVAAEAVAAHDTAVQETEATIDSLVEGLGFAKIEDESELHKQAQGLAQFMFAGYSDCIDKVAADGKAMGAIHKMMHSAKSHLGKGKKSAIKLMKRHGKGAAGGAAAGAAGGYFAKKHMDKKASDLTAAELISDVVEGIALSQAESASVDSTVTEGVAKLASAGASKAAALGEKLKKHFGKAKDLGKKHGAGALVGAAAGGAAGFAAGRHKKD